MTFVKRSVVANTDQAWFDFFRPTDQRTRLDEVNFWRPLAQQEFKALLAGEPFFFRLKHPINAIAGFGFFAVQAFMSVAMAWETFETRNGDPNFLRFASRIADYRRAHCVDYSRLSQQWLNCLVLREAVFLEERDWIPWGEAQEWSRNIVAFKTVDLSAWPGTVLEALIQSVPEDVIPDLAPEFEPLPNAEVLTNLEMVKQRIGQGTFRARLLRTYGGQCAISRERAAPALDAAHIQPYVSPASNHIQNGLLIRADLHRLYDSGYVTVTPDLEFEVSRYLRDEFENGKLYYQMHGIRIWTPEDPALQPSRSALEWHASERFLE